MSNKGPAYGDLLERQKRLNDKYSPEVEKELRTWIEKETGSKIGGSFQESLKDGQILCKLMNKLQPSSVKDIHSGAMPFKQMENIEKFLKAATAYGLVSEYLFQVADLFEDKNMTSVQVCLDNLHRISDIKRKGGSVEAQATKDSILLPKGKTAVVATGSKPSEPNKKEGILYEHNNKDKGAVNASGAKPGEAMGDLAQRLAIVDAKYDNHVEEEVRKWIASKTGEKLPGSGPMELHKALKDGVILCKLMNKIIPNSVPKINVGALAFKQMENIQHFLEAAAQLGVRPDDTFSTVALYEASNMTQVLQCLAAVKRLALSK